METILHLDSSEEFEKVMKEAVEYYYSSTLSNQLEHTDIIIKGKNELMKLLLNCKFETKNVCKLLIDKGFQEERIVYLENLLNEKKSELLYATLILQNCKYGETITGIDWLLKLVLGTSELNSLRYPLLQLIIMSTDSNDSQKKYIYDMNKYMLLKLIDVLENLDDL